MSDTIALVATAIIVGGIFLVIHQIEQRSKREGGLFTKPPSKTMRFFALVVGLFLGAGFLYELIVTGLVHIIFPVLAIALIAYGLGAGNLLLGLQSARVENKSVPLRTESDAKSSTLKRLMRLVLIVVIVLAWALAAIYGLVWLLGNATAGLPFVLALGVGLIAFIFLHLSTLSELYRAFRRK